MNFRTYSLVLLTGLLVNNQTAALSLDRFIVPVCAAVGVLANVFVSKPESIISANAYSVVGLVGVLSLVKPLHQLNSRIDVLKLAGALGLGFAIGRLANKAIRFLSAYGFGCIFGQVAPQAVAAPVENQAAVVAHVPNNRAALLLNQAS